jgi:hypothetical protein
MTTLRYRSFVQVEDLAVGECTIHRCSGSTAARWWLLWFYVPRETDGVPQDFCVPVAPGSYTESGPGGKTWGLTRSGAGVWQVSPSINVLNTGDAVAGPHALPSLWHQTPAITDVPEGERWIVGPP